MNEKSYSAGVALLHPGRKKPRYLANPDTAIEVFRRAVHLDEVTLRPVRGTEFEPCVLRRTSQGAVVVLKEHRV